MRVLTRFQGGRLWIGASVSTLQECREVHCQLRSVHRPAEGPVEGFSLDGRFQTCRVGMQPSTPSGKPAPLIDDGGLLAVDRSYDDPHHV